MISKIGQHIDNLVNNHQIITKTFQRNLQTITCKIGKKDNNVYFKSWRIDEYKHTRKLAQAYDNNGPIKGSQSIVDYFA